MKKCPKCGMEVPEESRFCLQCGNSAWERENQTDLSKEASPDVAPESTSPNPTVNNEQPSSAPAITTTAEQQAPENAAPAVDPKEEERKQREETMEFAKSVVESCTSLIGVLSSKVPTILLLIFFLSEGFAGYLDFIDLNFPDFNALEFLVTEIVMVILCFTTRGFFIEFISFICTIRISKWLRNNIYDYTKTYDNPYVFHSIITLKSYGGTFFVENRACINLIIRAFIYLKHPKGKLTNFAHLFLSLSLGLASVFFYFFEGVLLITWIISSIQAKNLLPPIDSLSLEELWDSLKFLVGGLIAQTGFDILNRLLYKQFLKQEEDLKIQYQQLENS